MAVSGRTTHLLLRAGLPGQMELHAALQAGGKRERSPARRLHPQRRCAPAHHSVVHKLEPNCPGAVSIRVLTTAPTPNPPPLLPRNRGRARSWGAGDGHCSSHTASHAALDDNPFSPCSKCQVSGLCKLAVANLLGEATKGNDQSKRPRRGRNALAKKPALL